MLAIVTDSRTPVKTTTTGTTDGQQEAPKELAFTVHLTAFTSILS